MRKAEKLKIEIGHESVKTGFLGLKRKTVKAFIGATFKGVTHISPESIEREVNNHIDDLDGETIRVRHLYADSNNKNASLVKENAALDTLVGSATSATKTSLDLPDHINDSRIVNSFVHRIFDEYKVQITDGNLETRKTDVTLYTMVVKRLKREHGYQFKNYMTLHDSILTIVFHPQQKND